MHSGSYKNVKATEDTEENYKPLELQLMINLP
jgi:hypothetical protein